MTKRLKRSPTRLQGEGDVINFIMQRDETPLAVSGVDTGRLATVCIPGSTGTNCTFDNIYKEEFLEMKNLKKVLALVLAMASVFGLSATAGAVASDFNDYEEIENVEAVEVMNALNVIGGNDKGDFNPDGYLTRAEMSKMVSYVMNGGKEPNLSSTATYSYTDTSYSWAKDYIEYVTSMGIVGGVGGGKFNPDGTLTGTQAAKMMLTSMGYDANVFGFGGTGWDVNVNRYANEAGLYDGLEDMQPDLPITRDDAAQLMYNAIQATMMKRTWTQNPATGEITETYQPWTEIKGGTETKINLLYDKFGASIGTTYMTGYDYDTIKEKWSYDFDASANFGGPAIKNGRNANDSQSSVDYTAMFGQQVKVIISNNGNTCYGVYANDSSVIATGASGEIGIIDDSGKTVEVNGTKYKVENTGINVYEERNNAYKTTGDTTLAAMKTSNDAFTFELVDNNGDNKADAVIYHPLTVAKITYVGKDSITLNKTINGSAVQNIDDIIIYDGYAKGDWVYVTKDIYATKDTNTFEKAEVKSATVSGVRDDSTSKNYDEYQLDGKWYSVADATNVDDMEVGDTVNYVAVGAKLFFAEITDLGATTKNLAMVVTADTVSNSGAAGNLGGEATKAVLILADGTTVTKTISKVTDSEGSTKAADVVASTMLGEVTPLIGKLVTYRVDGDNYELTEVDEQTSPAYKNLAGYNGFANGVKAYEDSAVGGFDLANDAVVFVWDKNGSDTGITPDSGNSAKVFSGSEIINQFGKKHFGVDSYTQVLTSNISGYTYAKVAVIVNDWNKDMPEITAGSNYGYLLEDSYRSYEDGKTYLNFRFYTSTGEVTAKQENTEEPSLYTKGNIITYDVVSDGVIKNVSEINALDGLKDGVVSGVGSSKVQIATSLTDVKGTSGSYTLNNDTTVIYVDSKNFVGADGDGIQMGNLYDDGTKAYDKNVMFLLNDSGDTLVLVVVDVNNAFNHGVQNDNP